jgi:glycosyltransferase involved in cell wall biosynthesis
MRILVVSPYYAPEPFRVPDVTAGLKARGHDVTVLTAMPNYPHGRLYPGYGLLGPYREEHDGITIWRAPVIPRGNGRAFRLALNYLSFAFTASMLALWLARRRWDVVFVFQLSPVTAILPAALLRALRGVPLAVWVQDLWPESVASSNVSSSPAVLAVARAISGWLYRRADHVLATSRAFQPRLEELGVGAERFEYLPQWAEGFFDEARQGPGSDAAWREGFPLMFAGNLGRVQALDTILDAAELTRDDPELHWVFVGDGSAREWLEGEVLRRRLGDRVFLLGRHPGCEMPAFFAGAAAMLVSLKRDQTMALTVPAKLQAYLAAGRPILASIDGEAARVVEESGGGYAAPAGDAVALAEIVRRMKALPAAEREAMGARGRTYSRRHFGREACLDQLGRALEKAASFRGCPTRAARAG